MDILGIISKELKEQGKSQKELCSYLSLDKRSFTAWKSGHSASYRTYLPQIADFLGVQVDYLLGRTDIKKAPTPEWVEARVMDRAERIQLMLVTCGWAKEGEELSPAKFAYISNLIELADAYFQETTDK